MSVRTRSTTPRGKRRTALEKAGDGIHQHGPEHKTHPSTFYVRVRNGRNPDGSLRYKNYGPFDDLQDAIAARDKHLLALATTTEPVALGKAEKAQTLREWSKHWLSVQVANDNAASTAARYAASFERHVLPALGSYPLGKLTKEVIESWREGLKAKGLGADSINYALKRLKTCLSAAQDGKLVGDNVATKVKFVEINRAERESNFADYPLLIAAAGEHHLAALIQVTVDTGLREGELAALHWADVELEGPAPHIVLRWHQVMSGSAKKGTQQKAMRPGTKTSKGKFFSVSLSQTAVAALTAHRARLAEHKLGSAEWNKLAGKPTEWFYAHGKNDRYTPSHKLYAVPSDPIAPNALVFPSACGGPLQTANMYGWFQRVCDRAGVTKTFHGMRHDCGSFMLAAGVPLTVVSRHLRHKNPAFTAEVYSHMIGEQERLGADALDQLWASLGAQAVAS